MVLINKADYLTATQRREWSDYLISIGWERPVFFSAVMEQQKIDDAARRERRRHEARIDSGNSGELEENNNNDELDGEEEEEEDPVDEMSAETEGADVTSDGGPDDGGIARPLTRQELIDTLRRYAHDHNCQPDPRFDDRIQFGMYVVFLR
jgi:large subunit GTPase 1